MSKYDYEKVKAATRLLLEGIGEDPTRNGLLDTPDRVAKMYQEILSGYDLDVADYITQFDNDGDYHGPVIVRDATFYTYCEHHLQLFSGNMSIAYAPRDKVVGLSKLIRVARVFCKRVQVQERLSKQIADALQEHLQPEWVVVKMEAEHFCISIRGVRLPGTTTETIYGHGDWPSDIFRQ